MDPFEPTLTQQATAANIAALTRSINALGAQCQRRVANERRLDQFLQSSNEVISTRNAVSQAVLEAQRDYDFAVAEAARRQLEMEQRAAAREQVWNGSEYHCFGEIYEATEHDRRARFRADKAHGEIAGAANRLRSSQKLEQSFEKGIQRLQ